MTCQEIIQDVLKLLDESDEFEVHYSPTDFENLEALARTLDELGANLKAKAQLYNLSTNGVPNLSYSYYPRGFEYRLVVYLEKPGQKPPICFAENDPSLQTEC